MNVTPEQKERFKSMIHNFAQNYDLKYVVYDEPQWHSKLEVSFRNKGSISKGKTYEVRFPEVRSLTEAGTAIFADALCFFGLINYETSSAPAVTIANVIYNPPATVVFWSDGSKTVVKCGENDEFDPEKGLAMAISKKMLGNQGNYYNEFKKWAGKFEVESLYPKFAVPALGITWEPPKLRDTIRDRLASIFRRGALG